MTGPFGALQRCLRVHRQSGAPSAKESQNRRAASRPRRRRASRRLPGRVTGEGVGRRQRGDHSPDVSLQYVCTYLRAGRPAAVQYEGAAKQSRVKIQTFETLSTQLWNAKYE